MPLYYATSHEDSLRRPHAPENPHVFLYRWAWLLWENGLCHTEILRVLAMIDTNFDVLVLADDHISPIWDEDRRAAVRHQVMDSATSRAPRRYESESGFFSGPPPVPGEEDWAARDRYNIRAGWSGI